jgi:hypothetical protein
MKPTEYLLTLILLTTVIVAVAFFAPGYPPAAVGAALDNVADFAAMVASIFSGLLAFSGGTQPTDAVARGRYRRLQGMMLVLILIGLATFTLATVAVAVPDLSRVALGLGVSMLLSTGFTMIAIVRALR